MKDRISAVQRVFWAVLVAALVVIAVGIPLGHDGETMDVLKELEAFKAGFPREKLERDLLTHAALQGVVQPADVIAAAAGPGVPKLSLADGALAVTPRAALELRTLEQVAALTRPDASLPIALLQAEPLGRALSWRLARRGGDEYRVRSITLTPHASSQEAVEREPQVAEARLTLLKTEDVLREATQKHERAEGLWEARRKWKAPWKAIARANEKRLEAKAAMQAAERAQQQAKARYEKLAKQAEAFEPAQRADRVPQRGVAHVELLQQPDGAAVELEIPVPLERRTVLVPHLTGADFPVTRASGLWPELKGDTIEQAIAQVSQRFSWHYAHVEVAGLKLGGMTVLQLSPLLLVLLLPQITRRATRVGEGYNPFDRPQRIALPRVGLGSAAANAVVVIALPLLGCVLCALSLVQIDRIPVIPLLCALGVIASGSMAQTALRELIELREAVLRSHSNPPPA